MSNPAQTNPKSEDDWLTEIGRMHPSAAIPGYWRTISENSTTWAAEISAGPFWSDAKNRVDKWRAEFGAATSGAELISRPGLPHFVPKSEASIRNKVARRCDEKDDYLAKAITSSGPPIPNISDLVRTRLTCPYIDGVEFLASKMVSLAEELKIPVERYREGRLEGYFAQHITITETVLYRLAGRPVPAEIRCEIQVASDLATRMWNESHGIYEAVRNLPKVAEEWQWKPTDPRFISNQLGHMIHLADGLLVQLRESTNQWKHRK